MATSGTMASPIIIVDDDEIPSPELRISRPRRGPRQDYRYLDYERALAEAIDDTTGSTSSRKRRRTETKERSTLDEALKNIRTTFDGEIAMLRERNRMLQDKLRLKRNKHKKGKEILIQLRENLRCKICYEHPGRWATLVCGHMFCLSCAENPKAPKKCPLCRAPVRISSMLPICRIERDHAVIFINHAVPRIISSLVVCTYVFVRSGLGRSGRLTKRVQTWSQPLLYIIILCDPMMANTDIRALFRESKVSPSNELYCRPIDQFKRLNSTSR